MKGYLAGAAFGFALIGGAHADGDELCTRLKAFEAAPLAINHANEPKGNWVTVNWIKSSDTATGYAIACAYDRKSAAEKAFCDWLGQNTSSEFHHGLPIQLLQCHGFAVPNPYPWMYPWIGRVRVETNDPNRIIIVDIALGAHNGPDAVRLAVLDSASAIASPLQPLFSPKDFTGELRQR
jgi:hypothetical protein